MQFTANIKKRIMVAAGTIGAFAASATSAFAANQNPQLGGGNVGTISLTPPSNVGFFANGQALVDSILKVIMVIGVILVFSFLVLGGIEYITSGGEKGKTEAARNKITSAVIGLIILAASYAILSIVLKFLGTSTSDVLNSF